MTPEMSEVATEARRCGFALGLFVAQCEALHLGHRDLVSAMADLVLSGACDKLALMHVDDIAEAWAAMQRTGNPVLIKKEEADGM